MCDSPEVRRVSSNLHIVLPRHVVVDSYLLTEELYHGEDSGKVFAWELPE